MTARRVLVVGASSGIGAAICEHLQRDGVAVAGAARRVDAIPVPIRLHCDARDSASCAEVVDAAVEALGGLDGLVYAAGSSPLRRLPDMTDADWIDLLRVNLVGPAFVTAAALPALRASGGAAVYLSSHSVPAPWPGLGAYAASKAGLETLVRAWTGEEPGVRFRTYVVGPTMTAFADGWDDDLAAELMPQWQAAGLLDVTKVRTAEDVAADVVAVLDAGDDHRHDGSTRPLP